MVSTSLNRFITKKGPMLETYTKLLKDPFIADYFIFPPMGFMDNAPGNARRLIITAPAYAL